MRTDETSGERRPWCVSPLTPWAMTTPSTLAFNGAKIEYYFDFILHARNIHTMTLLEVVGLEYCRESWIHYTIPSINKHHKEKKRWCPDVDRRWDTQFHFVQCLRISCGVGVGWCMHTDLYNNNDICVAVSASEIAGTLQSQRQQQPLGDIRARPMD